MNRIFLTLTLLNIVACNRVDSLDGCGDCNRELQLDVSLSTSTKGEMVVEPEDMGSIGLFCAMTGVDTWSSDTEFEKLYDRRFYVSEDGDWLIDGASESWGL